MFQRYSKLFIISLPLMLVGCLDCLDNTSLSGNQDVSQSAPIAVPHRGPVPIIIMPPPPVPVNVPAQVLVQPPIVQDQGPLYIPPHPAADLFVPPPPAYEPPIAYPVVHPACCDPVEDQDTSGTATDEDETSSTTIETDPDETETHIDSE